MSMIGHSSRQQQVSTVAGAAKGIGLACASCLGHEGAKVVVADIDEEGAKRYVSAYSRVDEVIRKLTLGPACTIWSLYY